MIKITIDSANSHQRLDVALSNLSDYSRSMIQKIIHANQMHCDNVIIKKPNKLTKTGEIYHFTPLISNFSEITPEPYNLNILYEDDYVIVINKPPELIVHPGAGNHNNTLINKLAFHCKLSNIGGPEKLGTVHRLDKGVSGCIIFAKDNITHMNLNQQFTNRSIKKQYIALTHYQYSLASFFAEDYIARSPTHRKKMAIMPISQGKIAQMNCKILKLFTKYKKKFAQIECNPITGRMHQIRVQLASRNLPIINDTTYGQKESKETQNIFSNRIALHAYKLTFHHPKTKEEINITTELPKSFFQFLEDDPK